MKIGKDLTDHLAKVIYNHNECTEYLNTLHLLLSMKTAAYGLEFQSINNEIAINIGDAQIEI
jgi:hypothetical protein